MLGASPIEKLDKASMCPQFYQDIQILRILVMIVYAAKIKMKKIPKYKKNTKSAHYRSGSSISALAAASFLLVYVMDKIRLLVQPLHVSSANTK